MIAFGDIGQEVKSSVIIDEEGLWVAALASNVVWTLHRVADKEDGPVQANDIVVAFATRTVLALSEIEIALGKLRLFRKVTRRKRDLRIELHSKASWVPCKVRKLLTICYSREPQKQRSFLANFVQKIGFAQLRDIFRDLEISKMT